MKYKNLGRTGVKVSELCLGTMIFGGKVDESSAIRMIRRAVDLGVNFIDTANNYEWGRSEEIVGKAIEGMRDDVVLATKVEAVTGPGPNDFGLSRKNVMCAVEASLKRLGTDYIDLYQVHHVDPSTPLKETLATLNDLVRSGKVRYVGCSNFPAWYLEKALKVSEVNGLEAFVTVQPRYNIVDRDVERELLPLCVEEGIGVIPYSPLAGGFLTGKYQFGKQAPEGSRGGGSPDWVSRRFTPRNHAVLQELERVVGETGLPMSQVCLAWLMANPVVTAPIVGASSLEQLEMNLDVINHAVPVEALRRISEVSKPDWLREQEEEEAQFQCNREGVRLSRWGRKLEMHQSRVSVVRVLPH
jgi:aryl-alcohol dehydrogenase-like predicted oxidoreductase